MWSKVKIFPHLAGNTLGSHKKFLKKLKKKGAKVVKEDGKSDAIVVVFCPIVSRFDTDVKSALTGLAGFPKEKLVLVAMHHTFDPDYILPDNRNLEQFELSVDCLFFEKTGLFKCPRNKSAIKKICKKFNISKNPFHRKSKKNVKI